MDLWQVSGEGKEKKLRIELHPGQTKAYDSKRRFVFVIAGTQSGKTSFAPIWLDREIREQGRGDYLAVTANYDLFKLKFYPEMSRYFEDLFGWEYKASERLFVKQDKPRLFTRIILRSADTKGGLESASAKGAVLDECGLYKLEAWDAVQRRLSLSEGRVLGVTTPYDLGWIYSQIYKPWTKGDKTIDIIQFKSIMNPTFPREEYYRMKGILPGWKFRMFYDGEFTRPAGLIYSDFNEDFHVIPDYPLPERFPRFLGVDFGAVNTAKIWIALDPANGFMIAYREKLGGDKTTREHVKEVRDQREPIVRAWGGSGSEDQQRSDWEDAGLPLDEPEIADVESGIDKVIEAFKTKKLYIFQSLTGLRDELGTYARKLDEFGEPTEEIKDKKNFHRLDALRYVVPSLMEAETGSENYQVNYA